MIFDAIGLLSIYEPLIVWRGVVFCKLIESEQFGPAAKSGFLFLAIFFDDSLSFSGSFVNTSFLWGRRVPRVKGDDHLYERGNPRARRFMR